MTRVDDGISPDRLAELYAQYGDESVKKLGDTLEKYIQSLTLLWQNKELDGLDGGPKGDLSRPILDIPDTKLDAADLSVLILKLQNENAEKQISVSAKLIKANKDKMKAQHDERIKKIMESIEKAEKAQKAGKLGKIFGWIATGIAVVAAIAACVATGGLALGPVIGAVMAVTMLALSETGVMNKMMEGLVNILKSKLGEPGAQIVAALIITAAVLAVSLGGPWVIGKIAAKLGAQVVQGTIQIARMAQMAERFGQYAKTLTHIARGASLATQVGMGVTGGVSGYYQAKSLEAKADAREIAKFIAKLQQQMEEDQDRIQELIEKIQSGVNVVMKILETDHETKTQITRISV